IGTTSRTSYLLDYDAVKTVTQTVADNDDSFYRMDKIFGARSKNDGAWHNYRTISTFSSTCNAGMSKLYSYLGLENSTNAYGCNGLTAVTSSLFSVKYTISNRLLADSNLRSYYTGSDGEFIYKNNYTLPIGYAINEEATTHMNLSSSNNGIENQNIMIQSMTGISDVFVFVDEFPTQSECTITPGRSGHLYLTIENKSIDYITVSINGTEREYGYSNLKNNNRIVDAGYVNATDKIDVTADSGMNLTAYILDNDKFIQAYNKLNSESYQVESFSDTRFKGTINVSEDKTLLFSIPFDDGWAVYVDGKRVTSYMWKKALLCVDIPKGEHTVELRYRPYNLITGCLITAFSIIILIGIYLCSRFIRNGKIKTDKWPVPIKKYLELPVPEEIKEDEFIHEDAEDFEDIENSILNDMNDFDNLEIPEPEENDSSEYDTDYPDDSDYPDNTAIKEDL
ncbi:MAG: YfhO family protein, partial [Lachnospira sp.]